MRDRIISRLRSIDAKIAVLASVLLSVGALGCARQPTADVTKARPVMENLLEAEREHRGTNGNYWRGTKTPIDRDDAVKNIGVDLADAAGFEFVAQPREDGADTTLRIIARGIGGASGVSIACVMKAGEAKPDCKETGG
jgi:hypothetical protein